MSKEKLSNRTLSILDRRRNRGLGICTMLNLNIIPTDRVWYSALDGTIYSIGDSNPNPEYPQETKVLTVDVDVDGLLPNPRETPHKIREIDEAIGGPEVDYAIERVLEQIRTYRELKGINKGE